MVSLVAFLVTAYGMNPYVVASFNSKFACENARAAILDVALKQSVNTTTTYAMNPRTMTCIDTPGLVLSGTRPPEATTARPLPIKPAPIRKPLPVPPPKNSTQR